MAHSRKTKQAIYEALPKKFIKSGVFVDGKILPEGRTHEEIAAWWAKQSDAFLLHALDPEEIVFDSPRIKRLEKIVGVKRQSNDDDDYDYQADVWVRATRFVEPSDAEELLERLELLSGGDEEIEDEPLTEEKLWEESERLAKPVLYLKTRRSKSSSPAPIAVWNSKLSSKTSPGVWTRVDLRHHPEPSLQAEGVLNVEFNRVRGGEAKFKKGATLTIGKGEKALYGNEDWDYPCLEVLEARAAKKIRNDFEASPVARQNYESGWWNESHPRDALSHTVYAQLGGWPISWPEEGAEDQLGMKLVLRTYADSEPWLEVLKVKGRYVVRERIT